MQLLARYSHGCNGFLAANIYFVKEYRMNYTEKYHLPQWEESDRVMRTDFNQAMAGIESGLDSHSTRIDQAQQAAANAQSTALTHKNYAIGSYTGTNKLQKFNLGFRPSFMLISGHAPHSSSDVFQVAGYFAITAGENTKTRISFSDTGFTVYPTSPEGGYWPDLNETNRFYEYIAFM